MSKRSLILIVGGIFVCLGAGVCTVLVRAGVIKAPNSEVQIDNSRLYAVTYVDDGDTFRINVDDREVRVRMLGVNTPETVDPRKKVQCFGPEASTQTKSLLKKRKVRLEFSPGRELKDGYGRYLAYVYREDDLFLNEFLIKNGFAREYTVGSPYTLQARFKAVQIGAQQEKAGLWGACKSQKTP